MCYARVCAFVCAFGCKYGCECKCLGFIKPAAFFLISSSTKTNTLVQEPPTSPQTYTHTHYLLAPLPTCKNIAIGRQGLALQAVVVVAAALSARTEDANCLHDAGVHDTGW